MPPNSRADEWGRLEAGLRARLDEPGGAALSYNALVLLCGQIEAGDDATYGDAMLLRFGQHTASGLRRLYEDRYGAPTPDPSGVLAYQTHALLQLVRDLQATAG